MIKGEIGIISESGRIHLDASLFEGIYVSNGNILFGIYYPPDTSKQYAENIIDHDFMLTPIPFEFWPTVTRIVIRMKHNISAIEKICQYLKSQGISILNANSSRSGYRFATWNLHINFDYLVGKNLKYDPEQHVFTETLTETEKLIQDLKKNCSDSLFEDPKDIDLKESIVPHNNTALPYFHQKSIENQKKDSLLYTNFSLRCDGNQIYSVTAQGGKLESILYKLNSITPIYPSLIYSEVDTNYLNIRLALIPNDLSKSIFRITIDYTRMNGEFSSKGLFNYVLNSIPAHYNVWKFYNHTKEMTPFYEKGRVYLILFKEKKILSLDRERKELYEQFESLNQPDSTFPNYNFTFNILPVSYDSIQQQFNRDSRKGSRLYYDLFISYAKENQSEARDIYEKALSYGLKPFLDVKDIMPGEKWEETLRESVNRSFEFCILYTPKCMQKEWVTTEWGAAWFLGRTITTITMDIPFDQLPGRLQKHQNVRYHEIDSFLEAVKYRRDEHRNKEFTAANNF